MDEETTKMIGASPFIREFTYYVIRSIQNRKGIVISPREVINTDLIPKVSNNPMQASMMKKPIVKEPEQKRIVVPKIEIPKQVVQTQKSVPPVQMQTVPIQRQFPKKNFNLASRIVPKKQENVKKIDVDGYGKIDLLLNDPSVSIIECSGPGRQIVVVRIGQRQFTQIVLSNEEIIQVLEEIANRAKIPLMEGVFRAAVDHFHINAVVGQVIGSRFVINKNPGFFIQR